MALKRKKVIRSDIGPSLATWYCVDRSAVVWATRDAWKELYWSIILGPNKTLK